MTGQLESVGGAIMISQRDLLGFGSSAVISECGRYRYELTRRWSDGTLLEFIMLNPSTADASVDDATIRRCIAFAKRWGYGGVIVRNLFAYRATDPRELLTVDDPIGPLNEQYLADDSADCTIAAWGANNAAAGWWSAKQWSGRASRFRRWTEPSRRDWGAAEAHSQKARTLPR